MNNLEFKKLADGRMAVRRRDGLPVTSADIELARQVAPPTRILAWEVCSPVLEAHVWYTLSDSFNPGDGLAVFYPDELEFLKEKDPQTLREIHQLKLTFGGGKVRQ